MSKFPKRLQGEFCWEIVNRYKTQFIVLEDMCVLSSLIGSDILILKQECNLQPLETYRLIIKNKTGMVEKALSFHVPMVFKDEELYH